MSWPFVKLKDCVEVVSGGTPKREEPSYWNGDIYWVTPKDLSKQNSIYLHETPEKITKLGLRKSSANLLPVGTVLFSSRAPIGHVAITKTEMASNQGFKSLVPKEGVDSLYLYFCMKFFKPALENLGNGATFKEVSKKVVENFEVPLPPLPVQKQIAAVLEKADTLRQQSQQMEQEFNSLAQSVFLDMFGDPITNSNSFKTISVGELAHVQIGPFGSMLHKSDYVSGGIPLINPTHIVDLKIRPNAEFSITEDKFRELPQYHLKRGDIIMGRRGEMGRCAVVTEESDGFFCGTGSLIIRPNTDLISSEYLAAMLSSSSVKNWFERESLGATMPNLNKGIVSKLQIPVPPSEVIQKYGLVKSRIQLSKKGCSDKILLMESNFNSLMQRAFKGKLNLKDVA